jgi:hypothetical protein
MLPTKTLEGGRLILPMNRERFERHQALVEDIAYSGMRDQEIAKKYGPSADYCWSSCRPTRNVMTTGSTPSCAGYRNGCVSPSSSATTAGPSIPSSTC